MKKIKWPTRLLCALLTVLMLTCMIPALTVFAEDGDEEDAPAGEVQIDHTKTQYESVEHRLTFMKKFYDNGEYSLYCDEVTAVVAYKNNKTGEVMFTNPWDIANKETSSVQNVRDEMMAQIVLTYVDSMKKEKTLTSYIDAILKGQYSISPIKNGVRVDYVMGETSARILVPLRIEKTAFEEKLDKPLKAKLSTRDYLVFKAYYSLKQHDKKGIAAAYPVTEKKGIDIYVYNDDITDVKTLRKIESWILAYCPEYTFAEMDSDYAFVEFEQDATSPPVFRMSLEYTIDGNGLSVNLPANGLRYDETAYRITNFQLLPYMGASYKGNAAVDGDVTYKGYTMLPDGSGALFDLTMQDERLARVYGEDYALQSGISGFHTEPMRMPVFGQVEEEIRPDGTTKRGFFAIIEEGDSLASLQINHTQKYYSSVIMSFITRQTDTSKSGWTAYAGRRYTDDYKIRYIMLNDDQKANDAKLSSYYECSWMGMACAYRDYLATKHDGFKRLTSEDVDADIPLYIETFGCMDTVKKVMSVPVTVSVALTSFEDVQSMYEFLLGKEVENVNFRLTGYANGGLYSDVPYKLKWEGSVGGKGDFKDLVEYAAAHPGLDIFPDFDFVYTTGSQNTTVNMKKNAARTVDNRYTARRTYSATQQTLVSYFQMVMSPATFDYFYEELEERYADYGNKSISLSTLGSDLNSDFDEEKTSLREDSKYYTMQALNYFVERDYSVMVDSGNAYTWGYVDHILNVPLDSNRYNKEKESIPFMGVVLHGYVEFAGSAFNMEGNLTYAMLKAIENGAGVYFVISYANTELLKEDVLLSQNYSVRYDIWQNRLVEIYHELNAVLADVQTKLIIHHENLKDKSTRVPDADELLQDALAEAEKQAQAVKDRAEKENAAIDGIDRVAHRIDTYEKLLEAQLAALVAQRKAGSEVALAIEAFKNSATSSIEEQKAILSALKVAISQCVAEPFAKLMRARNEMAKLVVVAKENYNYLVTSGANAAVCADARAELSAIIDAYVAWIDRYDGTVVTTLANDAKDAYIEDTAVSAISALGITSEGTDIKLDAAEAAAYFAGNDATVEAKYADMGIVNLMDAYSAAIKAAGYTVNIASMVNSLYGALEVVPEEPAVDSAAPVVTPTTKEFNKYAVDSGVVLVTYGESGAPYKSFILNFNDYAVRTEYNGVVYNVAAYGYAVIYH